MIRISRRDGLTSRQNWERVQKNYFTSSVWRRSKEEMDYGRNTQYSGKQNKHKGR